jgi:hypothetical protein
MLGLFLLMYVVDFVLGIVGIVGGIRRRDDATFWFGVGGLLLTVLPFVLAFAMWVYVSLK